MAFQWVRQRQDLLQTEVGPWEEPNVCGEGVGGMGWCYENSVNFGWSMLSVPVLKDQDWWPLCVLYINVVAVGKKKPTML